MTNSKVNAKSFNTIRTTPALIKKQRTSQNLIKQYIQKLMGSSWSTESLLQAYHVNNYIPTVLIDGSESNLLDLKYTICALNTLYYMNGISRRVYTGRVYSVHENFDNMSGELTFTFNKN